MQKKKEKEKRKTSIKKKSKTTSERVLLGIFLALLIIVIILGIFCIVKKQELSNNQNANIRIPIIEENANSELAINISNMEKGETKEYKFRITNYKEKKINKKQIKYNILYMSDAKIKLELYKNEESKNLLEKNKMEINNVSLKPKKKQEDLYHLKIKAIEEVPENTLLQMKITSAT